MASQEEDFSLGRLLDVKFNEIHARLDKFQAAIDTKADDVKLQGVDLAVQGLQDQAETASGQVSKLEEVLKSKANAQDVPTVPQFHSLVDAVQQKAEVTEVPTNSQLEAVKKLLDMKIDSPAVESIKDALECQLRAHATEFQASREAASNEAKKHMQELDDLRVEVARKAETSAVPTFQQLELRLGDKADVSAVPTYEQMQAMLQILELKADSAKVPTLSDLKALEEVVSSKASTSQVPTLANFELLLQHRSQVDAELRRMQEELARKADTGDVATALEVQLLNRMLQNKAESKDTPTLSQFQILTTNLENKADRWDVPSMSEFAAVNGSTVKMHAFEDLQRIVDQKADAESVHSRTELGRLLAEVASKEEFEKLKEETKRKADASDVPTNESIQMWKKDVASCASIRVLNQALHMKANSNIVATKEEIQALQQLLLSKADISSVPNWKDFHALNDRVMKKADRDMVPSTAQFQSLNSTVAKMMDGDSVEPLLKRRRGGAEEEKEEAPKIPATSAMMPFGMQRRHTASEVPPPAPKEAGPGTPARRVTTKSPATPGAAPAPMSPQVPKTPTLAAKLGQGVAAPSTPGLGSKRAVATPARAQTPARGRSYSPPGVTPAPLEHAPLLSPTIAELFESFDADMGEDHTKPEGRSTRAQASPRAKSMDSVRSPIIGKSLLADLDMEKKEDKASRSWPKSRTPKAQDEKRQPNGRVPKVKDGPKKGMQKIWNRTLGIWEEP